MLSTVTQNSWHYPLQDIYSPTGQGSYYDYWREYEGTPEGDEFNPEVITSPGLCDDHRNKTIIEKGPIQYISRYPRHGPFLHETSATTI
jgi:hypothetical protein